MIRADAPKSVKARAAPSTRGFPSWSRTEQTHCVARVEKQAARRIQILNLDDGKEHHAHSETTTSCVVALGDSIGFTAIQAAQNFTKASHRPDGTDLRKLNDAPERCSMWWSPDGQGYCDSAAARLAFAMKTPLYCRSPQPYAEIFVMNADGSNQRPSQA